MAVNFQPQVWGDKVFSPITKAIQAERDRQHQKGLADARNNLQQQNINMQKEAIGRALDQQQSMGSMLKQAMERDQQKFKYGKDVEAKAKDLYQDKKWYQFFYDEDDAKSQAQKQVPLPEYAPVPIPENPTPQLFDLWRKTWGIEAMSKDQLFNASGAK